MEPLPAAAIAGSTPSDVQITFFDDRLETIPFDRPADAVAISLETYTAKRAYQIASEYRRRGVPVIFGGFHATLMPEEAARFGDAVVIGESESIWPEVIDDLRHGTLQKTYRSVSRPDLAHARYDRSVYAGKTYLPIGLVETGRGCKFPCEFCAIQKFFDRSYRRRPIDQILAELETLRYSKKLFFFVDDNFAGDIRSSKELLKAIAPLNIRFITQMSINAAHDEEYLAILRHSGCAGVLIGFESLNALNLRMMNKRFNQMRGGYDVALANLRRHHIRIYATFVFGYENDTVASFDETVHFAIDQSFYIAAFNHLTPFPGTALYERLKEAGKLIYDAWWLDDRYRYNDVPFEPELLSKEEITRLCVESRRKFYSWRSIFRRILEPSNRSDGFMFRNYFPINFMHRADVSKRNGYPLGDENWKGKLLEAGA
jgi:radical SAM superfamily enzyme YgiQ (UPF0313 family)